jgi:hypothetical protein
MVWVHKEPANLIPQQGDEAGDVSVLFRDPCFGMNQINVSGVVRLALQKRIAEKRMGKVAGPQPNVDNGFGVFGFEFSDHCQSMLSLIEQPDLALFVVLIEYGYCAKNPAAKAVKSTVVCTRAAQCSPQRSGHQSSILMDLV